MSKVIWFLLMALAIATPSAAPAQGKESYAHCRVDAVGKVAKDTTVFTTSYSESDLKRLLSEFLKSADVGIGSVEDVRCYTFGDPQSAEQSSRNFASGWTRAPDLDWRPDRVVPGSSERRTETVSFRSPRDDERGYSGVTTDIEYQFIACMGELHIAYSLMDNSVGVGRLTGGGERLLTSVRGDGANYWYQGKVYKVGALPETVSSLPLKGVVWLEPYSQDVIGRFADDHAAKALGFGCFSGQTKKIADIKDLKTDVGKEPTKDELAKLLNRLRVGFETVEVLTSSAAEEEIRSGLAKAAADEYERSGQAGLDRAAEERAASRAAKEAEFQAKQKAYEEGVAAHKAALEQYQRALADAAAQQATGVAQARAAQEEFARKQDEYEAEAARARQAQEEYEAKYGSPQ